MKKLLLGTRTCYFPIDMCPATPLHIKPPNETCFNTLFATKYPLKATFFKNRIFPRCFGWLM